LEPNSESEPCIQKDGLNTTTLPILLEMDHRSGDSPATLRHLAADSMQIMLKWFNIRQKTGLM
jgi:hypothetical protein